MQRDAGVQLDRIGSGNRAQPIVAAANPGDGQAIGKAQHQLHREGHRAPDSAHDPHQIDLLFIIGQRHEINQRRRPRSGLEPRLEHRSPGPIAPRNPAVFRAFGSRTQQPPPVFRRPQQGRETGRRVETRQAQPIDRPVAPHQRRRDQIADQPIVADRFGKAAIRFGHLSQSRLPAWSANLAPVHRFRQDAQSAT